MTPQAPNWIAVLRNGRIRRVLPIPALPATLGSAPDSDLRLEHPALPPRAGCLLPGTGGELVFQASQDPSRQPLAPGEHLSLGPYTLAFLALASPAPDPASVVVPTLGRLIPALLKAEEEEEFFRVLLEATLSLFTCSWGAVLELPENAPARPLRATGVRPGRDDLEISRSVVARLREEEGAVLQVDTEATPDFQAAASLHQDVRTVIACRFPISPGLQGALYLESPGETGSFGPGERDLLENLSSLAGIMLSRSQDHRRAGALARAREEDRGQGGRILGNSPPTRSLREQIDQAASHQVTTLILGESGTGKELVARAIHARSPRRDGPFVAVHCMALNPELIESELFGHRRGAFSGAQEDRLGRFEMAQGGTLFLDELGELSPAIQVKLLRTLEMRTIERVGEGRERPIDVHLLAATNADLAGMIRKGSFREDLFYRLSVFRILVPPLRDRPGDLDELLPAFLSEGNRLFRKAVRGIAPEARRILDSHPWPGNVRELRNLVHQAVIRESGEFLTPASLSLLGPRQPSEPAPAPAPALPRELEAARAEWERSFLLRALEEEGGNVTATHRRLGLSRPHLYRKLSQYGIRPEDFRP